MQSDGGPSDARGFGEADEERGQTSRAQASGREPSSGAELRAKGSARAKYKRSGSGKNLRLSLKGPGFGSALARSSGRMREPTQVGAAMAAAANAAARAVVAKGGGDGDEEGGDDGNGRSARPRSSGSGDADAPSRASGSAAELEALFAEHEPSLAEHAQALCDRGIATPAALASLTDETVRGIPGLGTPDMRSMTVAGRRLTRLRTKLSMGGSSAEERTEAAPTRSLEGGAAPTSAGAPASATGAAASEPNDDKFWVAFSAWRENLRGGRICGRGASLLLTAVSSA
jgi:hypothetical protein